MRSLRLNPLVGAGPRHAKRLVELGEKNFRRGNLSRCLYGGLMKSRECRVSVWNWPQTRDTLNVSKDAVPQEKMPLPRRDEEASWQRMAVIVDHLSVVNRIEDIFEKDIFKEKGSKIIRKPVESIYRLSLLSSNQCCRSWSFFFSCEPSS